MKILYLLVFIEMVSPIKIWRESKERYQYLGKIGRLVSFTKIKQAPAGFANQVPYWVGIVKFTNGKKTTGQLVLEGVKKIKIGDKVLGVIRCLKTPKPSEVIEYGIKYRVIGK